MVIHAHLEDSAEPAGRSREPRRTLLLETKGVTTLGDAAHVLIHNVSATGLLLETQVALEAGQRLTIDLPQAGATLATVMWQSGHLFGCQFKAPITSAVLSAAQLRGAVAALAQGTGNFAGAAGRATGRQQADCLGLGARQGAADRQPDRKPCPGPGCHFRSPAGRRGEPGPACVTCLVPRSDRRSSGGGAGEDQNRHRTLALPGGAQRPVRLSGPANARAAVGVGDSQVPVIDQQAESFGSPHLNAENPT
jgi:hypothetical protein